MCVKVSMKYIQGFIINQQQQRKKMNRHYTFESD